MADLDDTTGRGANSGAVETDDTGLAQLLAHWRKLAGQDRRKLIDLAEHLTSDRSDVVKTTPPNN